MIYNAQTPATSRPRWLSIGPISFGISGVRPTMIGKGAQTGAWLSVGFDLCGHWSHATEQLHLWFGPRIFGWGFHLHLSVEK